MSEKFSAALRLTDLNDFISPSQDCIVSLKKTTKPNNNNNNNHDDDSLLGKVKVNPLSKPSNTDVVKISLKDCLACRSKVMTCEQIKKLATFSSSHNHDSYLSVVRMLGSNPNDFGIGFWVIRFSMWGEQGYFSLLHIVPCGSCNSKICTSSKNHYMVGSDGTYIKGPISTGGCITSAETVMLEKQSLNEFLSHIGSEKAVILSLSPQSRASLASYFDLTPTQVFRKLTTFFKSLGVKAVYDTSCSRDLALIECCNEFVSRYKQHQLTSQKGCHLPMISSACPGWICYAEKTLGSYILPYISSVKSPQQTIGAAIKHHIVRKMGLMPENVYHVTVMPCYDKKLEAARDDFVFPVGHEGENGHEHTDIAEVDSVLTSGEVLDLIQLKSIDFKTLEEATLDRLLTNVDEEGHLYGVSGGSGGYAESIFRHAAKTLFGKEIEGPLVFRTIRNSDFQEVTLQVEGEVVLKFALCYGFRNLQNIVRKIKIGKCDYHFLEVMACPSGCLNGGGQIKPKMGQSAKDTIQLLENVYMQEVKVADPFDNPIVKGLYDEWLVQPGSETARRFVHTEYHPMVKSAAAELHNW